MEDLIIKFISRVEPVQIISIGGMFWFFYSRFNGKIEKLESKIENLSSKIEDVDRRLCRIEGSLSTHGHCLFHQSAYDKKAL